MVNPLLREQWHTGHSPPPRRYSVPTAAVFLLYACVPMRAEVLVLTGHDAIHAADVQIGGDGRLTFIQPEQEPAPATTVADIRWVQFEVRDCRVEPAAWLCLQDGRRLRGKSIVAGSQQIMLQLPDDSVEKAPIDKVAAIFFRSDQPSMDSPPASGVRILSANGEALNAPAVELTAAGAVIDVSPDTDPILLPRERLKAIIWPFKPIPGPGLMVELRTGERLIGQGTSLDHDHLKLSTAEGNREFPRSEVRCIRPGAGRMHLLENLILPVQATKDRSADRPARNALGGPIHLGARLYPHGVGLRGPAQLDIPVPQGATWFIARAGLDADAARFAHGTFTMLLDDQPKIELKDLAPHQPARPVAVRVQGAKKLTVRLNPSNDDPTGCLGDLADAMFIE